MTDISRRTFVAGTAAAATGLASGSAVAATTTWDLSTVWPDSNFHTANAKRFAEEVKLATNGNVVITVKSGGQLGFKGPEHLRAVRDGLVPMADVLNIQQIGDEPLLGAEGVPFLVGDAAELKVLHKYLRPEYEKVAARNNQKIIYMVPWPTQYLHLKFKADDVAALKGVKIRVPDKNAQDLFAAVGMGAVLIPWGETIPALASGAVSGVATSSVSGVDGKFWEFLKFFHQTNHMWSCQIVTVNLDAWKKLPVEQQKAIEDIGRKLEPGFWDVADKADGDSAKRLAEGGMTLVKLPAPMMAELRSLTKPLLEAFLKRVPSAEAPIKAYLAEMKRA